MTPKSFSESLPLQALLSHPGDKQSGSFVPTSATVASYKAPKSLVFYTSGRPFFFFPPKQHKTAVVQQPPESPAKAKGDGAECRLGLRVTTVGMKRLKKDVDVSLGQNVCPFWIAELVCLVARGTLMQRAGTSPRFSWPKGTHSFYTGLFCPKVLTPQEPQSPAACDRLSAQTVCPVPSPGGIQPVADLVETVWWPLLCFCKGLGHAEGCMHHAAPWAQGTAARILSHHRGWRKGTELPSAAMAKGWRTAQALHLALLPAHVQEFSRGSEIHPSCSRAGPRAYACFVLL